MESFDFSKDTTQACDVALSLHNLAVSFTDQGEIKQAETIYKRALAIFEMSQGPDHPSVAKCLTNLAKLYDSQEQFAQAEQFYKRARDTGSPTARPKAMRKMSSDESWKILNDGVKFAKHLDQINQEISNLQATPNNSDIKMLLRTNEELLSLACLFVQEVRDATEMAGWWKKRSAKKLLNMLLQNISYSQFQLTLLETKLELKGPGSR